MNKFFSQAPTSNIDAKKDDKKKTESKNESESNKESEKRTEAKESEKDDEKKTEAKKEFKKVEEKKTESKKESKIDKKRTEAPREKNSFLENTGGKRRQSSYTGRQDSISAGQTDRSVCPRLDDVNTGDSIATGSLSRSSTVPSVRQVRTENDSPPQRPVLHELQRNGGLLRSVPEVQDPLFAIIRSKGFGINFR